MADSLTPNTGDKTMSDKDVRFLVENSSLMGITLSEQQAGQLVTYFKELEKWNKKINLSGIRQYKEMLTLHGLDSLSLSKQLGGHQILDVGTGAGLPGIPLSIVHPSCHFTLLDSNQKKIAFVQHAKTLLGLDNITPLAQRVEAWDTGERFDTVIARAFAPLEKIVRLCGHLLAVDGTLVAMKGREPTEELRELPETWQCQSVEVVTVPNLDAERHFVRLIQSASAARD